MVYLISALGLISGGLFFKGNNNSCFLPDVCLIYAYYIGIKVGWHVPTDEEWIILKDYLGAMAGGRMKETGTIHWNSPNIDATNESKFTALPGGYREYGRFEGIGSTAEWWSTAEGSNSFGHWYIYSSNVKLEGGNDEPEINLGASVRCIKDN